LWVEYWNPQEGLEVRTTIPLLQRCQINYLNQDF